MSYPEFSGKVAFVTGGGKGLGRAIALAFARDGARVAFSDLDDGAAKETTSELKSLGCETLYLRADISKAADMAAAVAGIMKACGRIDYLVNNAGVSQKLQLLTDVDEAEYTRVMDVNVKGTWLGMKYCIPEMLKNGGGCIVNISSAMGLVAQPRVSIYAASKHAVIGLTKTAAIEFGRRNIRVNVICPGRHDTPMVSGWRDPALNPADWQAQIDRIHPATGRVGRPEEIAAAALFLCSDGASNVHGVTLPVDGGWTAQ